MLLFKYLLEFSSYTEGSLLAAELVLVYFAIRFEKKRLFYKVLLRI